MSIVKILRLAHGRSGVWIGQGARLPQDDTVCRIRIRNLLAGPVKFTQKSIRHRVGPITVILREAPRVTVFLARLRAPTEESLSGTGGLSRGTQRSRQD
ncbi:MAG TPA: hypothetical protein VEQ60_05420, partial [Longimicrobium sp.]|nr:hypothetical protein [Longimicrobium sp.]